MTLTKWVLIFCGILLSPVYAIEHIEGKVIKIKDGDTFVLLLDNKSQLTIRLAYIDCPEKGQAYYQAAKDFTSRMIFGSRVKCEVLKKEKYRRSVAIVYLPDSTQLNEFLVRKGLAWNYKEYSAHTRMHLLEEKARNEKLGLWKENNPIPPWLFRKNKKVKQ